MADHDHEGRMLSPADLLENNRRWVQGILNEDADYFSRLAAVQKPAFLWIGCSDSRVPANTIVGLKPGEVFVHRNIANVVPHSDLNVLSVIQYAVEILEVRHILVVGHYGCGGVQAALSGCKLGAIDNWLAHIRDVWRAHYDEIPALPEEERPRRLVELNVMAQVHNVARTASVQKAWADGRALAVHGWVYDIADGLLRDLGVTIRNRNDLHPAFRLNSDEA